MFPKFTKDPDEILDYQIDWENWLDGDTISASSWTLEDGITEHINTTFTSTTATLWVASGTLGTMYEATNHITTVAGREKDQTIRISIIQK